MNWVDLAIILILCFFIFEGTNRGFIGELLDFLAFLLSFIFSIRFYNDAAIFLQTNFSIPHSLANVLGFIGIWFLVESVLFTIIKLLVIRIRRLEKITSYLNPYAFIPSFLRGLLFIGILLLIIGSFPIQPRLKLAVQNSKVGALLLSKIDSLETPIKNVFGGVTQDSLTFLTIKPKSDETVDLGFKTTEFDANPTLEERMIRLVNMERSKVGLKTLEFDSTLRDVGRGHSSDMFERGYFSHYSPEGKNVADRAQEKQVDYFIIGENLAYAPTLDLAHAGLMNSEGHRANILSSDYNKVGIGIMESKIYGLMITQVFLTSYVKKY